MKQALTILFVIALFSCSEKSHPKETFGDAKIVAVWTKRDSTKELNVMFRRIAMWAYYDSVANKKEIKIDTFWWYPTPQALIDKATNKPVIDSVTNKPLLDPEPLYIPISKDSVNWKVAGIPLEELLKKSK